MSKGHIVTKGIRQGCPFYPCIFVTAVEQLTIAVRCNIKIKGITENDEEKKFNQFTENTISIIAAEDESLKEAIKTIDHFQQLSGLWMNKNTNTIIRPGSIAHSDLELLSGKDLN